MKKVWICSRNITFLVKYKRNDVKKRSLKAKYKLINISSGIVLLIIFLRVQNQFSAKSYWMGNSHSNRLNCQYNNSIAIFSCICRYRWKQVNQSCHWKYLLSGIELVICIKKSKIYNLRFNLITIDYKGSKRIKEIKNIDSLVISYSVVWPRNEILSFSFRFIRHIGYFLEWYT